MATQEPEYEIVATYETFEVRDYKPYVLAEVVVSGELEEASSRGFRLLADYIFGKNHPRAGAKSEAEKIAMTAPVIVTADSPPSSESIPMTTPVNVSRDVSGAYRVQFTMPSKYTLETLPLPNDPRVVLKPVPARRLAVRQYAGTWSQDRFEDEKSTLVKGVQAAGLKPAGEAAFARYNSPFSLWFLRRNEVWVPIEGPAQR